MCTPLPQRLLKVALVCWALFNPAPSLLAGEVQGEPRFGEIVDVELFNLDLVVSDKSGNPITDLGRDDFTVEVDGEPVEITHFAMIAPTPPPILAPGEPVGTEAPDLQLPERPLRSVIIYVDDNSLRPHSRKALLNKVKSFVAEDLADDEQVMIVSAGPRNRIRLPLTLDHSKALAALEVLEREAPWRGLQEDNDMSVLLNEVAHMYQDADIAALEARRVRDSYRVLQEQQLASGRISLTELDKLVTGLGGLGGEKTIVHLSDGLPEASSQAVLRMLIARASANRIRFVTVDGGGAERFDPRQAEAGPGPQGFWTPEAARGRMDLREATLISLSGETGGGHLYLKNLSRPSALRALLDVNYSLAFEPPRSSSGTEHQIVVEVARKGVDIRYPTTFRTKAWEEDLSETVLAALMTESLDVNELGVVVALGKPAKDRSSRQGASLVPIRISIPVSQLTLLPEEKFSRGVVSVAFGIRDSQGRSSSVLRDGREIVVANDQVDAVRGQSLDFEMSIRVSPFADRLTLLVKDEVGQVISLLSQRLNL